MAGKDDSGDKTEKPTPHRLAEARRKGDVAKSKDVGATVGLLVWALLFALGASFAGKRIAALFDMGFMAIGGRVPFSTAMADLGWAAAGVFLSISALVMIPAASVGLLAEFLQVGPVMAPDKLKPSLDKLNPVEGLKRMFSLDNLVELLKTLVKTVLLLLVAWVVIRAALPGLLALTPRGALPTLPGAGRDQALAVLAETGALTTRLLGWTLAVFLLVAILDRAWQQHSYLKKLRMSRRDIKDEVKQDEGDPHVKASRRQLHQEWASQNAVAAARNANVLVVNPTHIAVALEYDPDTCPVPMVAAMGEGPLAQAMREAAEAAGVPVIREVEVARALFARGTVDEIVPEDMFEAIAEILVWARQQRDATETRR